jgi:hypothetical protein
VREGVATAAPGVAVREPIALGVSVPDADVRVGVSVRVTLAVDVGVLVADALACEVNVAVGEAEAVRVAVASTVP